MEELFAKTKVSIPTMLAELEQKEEKHTGVIPKADMPAFVLNL